jgi:hypothetical protein
MTNGLFQQALRRLMRDGQQEQEVKKEKRRREPIKKILS